MEKLIPYYDEGLPAEEMEKRDLWGNQWIDEQVEFQLSRATMSYASNRDVSELVDVIREYFDFGEFKVREDITEFDKDLIGKFLHMTGCTDCVFGYITDEKEAEIAKDWKNGAKWTAIKGIISLVAEFEEE